MLQKDCEQFVGFLRERDPVIVLDYFSNTGEVRDVERPWERGAHYWLWNQGILSNLNYKLIRGVSSEVPSYSIDSSSPIIQFWYASPVPEQWNGRPAITQGRVWANVNQTARGFESWYNAVVRWIRKNFVRDTVLGDYVGPSAYQWFKDGGLLLPHLLPPVTSSWLSWVEAQDQHRAVFSK